MAELLGQYINNYEDIHNIDDDEDEFEDREDNQIYRAYNTIRKENCILKIINKKELLEGDFDLLMEHINNEEKIAKLCKSENTLNLIQKLETEDSIIFEYEDYKHNLMSCLRSNGELEYKKNFFKKIVISIAKALKTIHEKGVMHMNIKPCSMFYLFNNNPEDGDDDIDDENIDDIIIKLGDFSCSIFIKDNDSEPIGSLLYAAPEIIKNFEYDEKCDLWSLGVSLFELYFGVLPYGTKVSNLTIKKIIFSKNKDNFKFRKTGIPCLDILFRRLLVIDPEERMTFQEFFDFVLNDNFMKTNEGGIYQSEFYINRYKNLYDLIQKQEQIEYNDNIQKESFDQHKIDQKNLEKILTYVEGGYFPDFLSFVDEKITENSKFNNIIYYDETNDLSEFKQNCYYFENVTHGAFMQCTNLDSFKLIKEEILKQNKKDKRINFNLVTTGSKCEKIMTFLDEEENKQLANCINNVCVFCFYRSKWSFLKEKYEKVYDVYNGVEKVINFISETSSKEIKPFKIVKLITFRDYVSKYREKHLAISKFYGDLTKDSFSTYLGKMKDIINIDTKNGELIFPKYKVEQGFYSFNLTKDLEELNKIVINEYTKKSYYIDLNKWLMKNKMNSYETIAYFTARLMYSLNSYAEANNMFYTTDQNGKNEVYRGVQLTYTNLLPYERAKGQIILLSSFTSTSECQMLAETWAGRGEESKIYNSNLNFSVVFIIKNCLGNANCISNGINIQKVAAEKEREILYQPFSFYFLRNVEIDMKNYRADIYLETIGKTEILEEQVKNGKNLEYNRKMNIMEVRKDN